MYVCIYIHIHTISIYISLSLNICIYIYIYILYYNMLYYTILCYYTIFSFQAARWSATRRRLPDVRQESLQTIADLYFNVELNVVFLFQR